MRNNTYRHHHVGGLLKGVFLLFSLILLSSWGETMLAISITITYRYDESCLMTVVISATIADPPLESLCSEEATISLCLRSWPSSSLAAAREAAIKPEGCATRLFSRVGSSIGRFLLSPSASLSFDLDDPVAAYCCGRAGRVEGEGLDDLAWCARCGGTS